QLAVRVGDFPMPGLELHLRVAAIGDLDRVSPEVIAVLRRRALRHEARRNLHLDVMGGGAIHRNPACPAADNVDIPWAAAFFQSCKSPARGDNSSTVPRQGPDQPGRKAQW